MRASRFSVAGFAVALAGLWSFSAAAQNPLRPEVTALLNDSNFCWETESLSFKKVTVTSQELRARLANPRSKIVDVELDLRDPAKPRIVAIRYQASGKSYTRVPCASEVNIPPPALPPSEARAKPALPPSEARAKPALPSNQGANIFGGTGDLTNNGFPPPPTGLNVGGFVSGGTGQNNFTERFAATGEALEVNSLGASAQIGGGGHVGFVIPLVTQAGGPSAPGVGPIVIEPFVEFGDSNEKSKIDFGSGASLSAHTNFNGTLGINVGPTLITNGGTLWPHVVIGASFQNETFNFDFIPTASSASETVWGFTTGFGVAFMPNGLQVGGMPIMVWLDYRHTAWQTVTVRMPAASPLTNFDFKASSDELRVGASVFLPQAIDRRSENDR